MKFDKNKLERCKEVLHDHSISIIALANLVSYDNNTNNNERRSNLDILYHFKEAAKEVNINKKVEDNINECIILLKREIRKYEKLQ